MTNATTINDNSGPSVSISISDAYDGGNGVFVEQKVCTTDPDADIEVVINIRPDVYTELEEISHMQYFSFRATIQSTSSTSTESISGSSAAPGGVRVKYVLGNASNCSYPEAWSGTTVCWSNDLSNPNDWKRNLTTAYTTGQLSWTHIHSQPNESIYFAYHPPYSYERHLGLIAKCCSSSKDASVQHLTLGQSLEGREMDCIKVGTGDLIAWIIHRQHPGETQAEHYAEGLLERLLGFSSNDPNQDTKVVDQALQAFTFYIVPCMCPDGAVKGHLRTNAVGANLNREWATIDGKSYQAPSLERSPEVYCVLEKMKETNVDVFLDIHSDEELPFNFISGAELVPNWSPRLKALHGAFTASYSRHNSDMQQRYGYPAPASAEDVLKYMNVATNQVVNRFQCMGMTLEMPFKDCLSNPDPESGWTPERGRRLGASVLEPLLYVQPFLRADSDEWITTCLKEEDAYVATTDDYEDAEGNENDGEFKMLKKRFYSDVHEFRKVNSNPVTSLAGN